MKIYTDNGLPFLTAADITKKEHITKTLVQSIKEVLETANSAWVMHEIEAPCLIPTELVSPEYAEDSYYTVGEFHLRPETTASSYAYAAHLNEHQSMKPPFCVWQLNKSFRRENDQVSKNMRFKEFYQLEFQCIFTADTLNDYHKLVQEPMREAVETLTGLQTRLVLSDRLPKYSLSTIDIEVKTAHKWLEVCSISLRNDVPFQWNNKDLLNVEIAFGADRLRLAMGGTND